MKPKEILPFFPIRSSKYQYQVFDIIILMT